MHYQQIQPSRAAAKFVEFYWTLEDESPLADIQTVVPDGRAGIILNFGRPFESYAGGAWTSQPQSFFVGQITGPLLLRPSGATAVLGVQFRPHGAARIVGQPMAELSDGAFSLPDLSARLHRQFQRILDLGSPARAVRPIDRWFSDLAARDEPDSNPLSFALEIIENSGGAVDLDKVAQAVGWTARHLQRTFKDQVGITPKFFARMQRFQEVLRALEDRAPRDWVGLALRCGYYDQAHLIRDFRQFSGKPPTAILETELDFTKRFVRQMPRGRVAGAP